MLLKKSRKYAKSFRFAIIYGIKQNYEFVKINVQHHFVFPKSAPLKCSHVRHFKLHQTKLPRMDLHNLWHKVISPVHPRFKAYPRTYIRFIFKADFEEKKNGISTGPVPRSGFQG